MRCYKEAIRRGIVCRLSRTLQELGGEWRGLIAGRHWVLSVCSVLDQSIYGQLSSSRLFQTSFQEAAAVDRLTDTYHRSTKTIRASFYLWYLTAQVCQRCWPFGLEITLVLTSTCSRCVERMQMRILR